MTHFRRVVRAHDLVALRMYRSYTFTMTRYSYALAACTLASCSGEPPRSSASPTPSPTATDGGNLSDAGTTTDVDATKPPISNGPKCDSTKAFGPPVLLMGLAANSTTLDVFRDELIVTEGYLGGGDKAATKLVSRRQVAGSADVWAMRFEPALMPWLADTTTKGFFDPSFADDGLSLYFVSGPTIFKATRTGLGTQFGNPTAVILSSKPTASSAEAPRFRQYRSEGKEELCFSTNSHISCTVKPVGSPMWPDPLVQTFDGEPGAGGEVTPVMSADGKTMYFAFVSAGGSDQTIYIASRTTIGGAWSSANSLGGVNSTFPEQPVWISDDECTLYLTSTRLDAQWKVFVATRKL
jgi:hypothetical protein